MKVKKNIYLCLIIIITLVYLVLLTILYCSESADDTALIRTFGDAFWYSLVTLTTVGYGDLTPVTPLGHAVGIVFLLLSAGIMVTLLGAVVSFVTSEGLPFLMLSMQKHKNWYYFADCEAEFGVVANALEYIRILKLAQENEKAQNILNQWKYYVSKQGDLEHIRQRVVKRQQAFQEEMARIRNTLVDDDLATSQQSYFDNIFKKEIVYNNIMIDEEGITIINADGSLKLASSDEEEHCLITIKEAVANGSLTLNRVQLNLLNSYTKSSYKKR